MFCPILAHIQRGDLKKLLRVILSDFYANVEEVDLAVAQKDQEELAATFATSATETDADYRRSLADVGMAKNRRDFFLAEQHATAA